MKSGLILAAAAAAFATIAKGSPTSIANEELVLDTKYDDAKTPVSLFLAEEYIDPEGGRSLAAGCADYFIEKYPSHEIIECQQLQINETALEEFLAGSPAVDHRGRQLLASTESIYTDPDEGKVYKVYSNAAGTHTYVIDPEGNLYGNNNYGSEIMRPSNDNARGYVNVASLHHKETSRHPMGVHKEITPAAAAQNPTLSQTKKNTKKPIKLKELTIDFFYVDSPYINPTEIASAKDRIPYALQAVKNLSNVLKNTGLPFRFTLGKVYTTDPYTSSYPTRGDAYELLDFTIEKLQGYSMFKVMISDYTSCCTGVAVIGPRSNEPQDLRKHLASLVNFENMLDLTFSHEVGHNLDAQHDRVNVVDPKVIAQIPPDNFAYTGVILALNHDYGTNMAVNQELRIPVYSGGSGFTWGGYTAGDVNANNKRVMLEYHDTFLVPVLKPKSIPNDASKKPTPSPTYIWQLNTFCKNPPWRFNIDLPTDGSFANTRLLALASGEIPGRNGPSDCAGFTVQGTAAGALILKIDKTEIPLTLNFADVVKIQFSNIFGNVNDFTVTVTQLDGTTSFAKQYQAPKNAPVDFPLTVKSIQIASKDADEKFSVAGATCFLSADDPSFQATILTNAFGSSWVARNLPHPGRTLMFNNMTDMQQPTSPSTAAEPSNTGDGGKKLRGRR